MVLLSALVSPPAAKKQPAAMNPNQTRAKPPVSYYGTIFSPFTVLRSLAMLASPPTPAYPARVDLFVGLMRKRVRFHPVEVLVEPDGQFVIGDGHHRTAASLQCGYTHLPTLLYASQERRRVALPWGGVCRHKKEPRAD
jgi:hypothetical protein